MSEFNKVRVYPPEGTEGDFISVEIDPATEDVQWVYRYNFNKRIVIGYKIIPKESV